MRAEDKVGWRQDVDRLLRAAALSQRSVWSLESMQCVVVRRDCALCAKESDTIDICGRVGRAHLSRPLASQV